MGQDWTSFQITRPRWMVAVGFCIVLCSCDHSTPNVPDVTNDGVITAYCLGDSNTDVGDLHTPKWCELTAAHFPSWKFINGGFARAKASGDCFLCGKTLLTAALFGASIDLVIVALGTNDRDKPFEIAAEAILSLRDQAEHLHLVTLVATVPPVFATGANPTWVTNVNDVLRARVAKNRLIDFFTAMAREDFLADGIHINDAGQQKRAAAALRTLRALQ